MTPLQSQAYHVTITDGIKGSRAGKNRYFNAIGVHEAVNIVHLGSSSNPVSNSHGKVIGKELLDLQITNWLDRNGRKWDCTTQGGC